MAIDHIQEPAEGHIHADDGERLYFRVDGKGPPIVAVHGGPGFSMTYLRDGLLPLARGRTLIFYDQRGCGRSSLVADDARITADAHVDDLEAVRRHFGLERVDVIGHSWGAGPAGLYAARYPERVATLVLANPLAPRHRPWRDEFVCNRTAWMDEATRAQLAALQEDFANAADTIAAARAFWALFFRGYFVDPVRADGTRIRVADDPVEAVRNTSRVNALTMASLGDYDWRDVLRAVTARTLVIHGEADPIPLASAREWAASIAGARMTVLERCGHFPWLEQPQAFFAAIEAF